MTWKLAELIELYDIEAIGTDRYRAAALPASIRPEDEERQLIEGSQLLGQALVAASRAESQRFVKSGHMIFSRAASIALPVDLAIDRLHSGRGFSSLSVSVSQGERRCAQGLFLLDTDEPDCIHHATSMPELAPPERCAAYDMPLQGRELRIVEGSDFEAPEAVGPATLDIWARYANAPVDTAMRQALLALLCGPFTIGTSLRPHAGYGQSQAHLTLSTGVLSLGVHFHEPCALDDWLLYSHESIHAGRGLCDGKGRIFERSGRLVASFEQTALLRPLPGERVTGRDAGKVL